MANILCSCMQVRGCFYAGSTLHSRFLRGRVLVRVHSKQARSGCSMYISSGHVSLMACSNISRWAVSCQNFPVRDVSVMVSRLLESNGWKQSPAVAGLRHTQLSWRYVKDHARFVATKYRDSV